MKSSLPVQQSVALPSTNSLYIEQLYIAHFNWLTAWLSRKITCKALAADFAQETFCRLLSKKTLEELKQPRAFLSTSALRIMIDAKRRKVIEQQYLTHYYYHHGEQATSLSEEALAIISESLLHIITMLDNLPLICQQAFLMNRLAGLRHNEIATKLNIAPSTVKKYIAKALLHCHFAVTH